jgi:uncharacterized protein (TIGR02145 family)
MKRLSTFYLLFIFTGLLITHESCKKEKEAAPPDEHGVIIAENAKVIDQSIWQESFVSMDSSAYSYIFNNNINSLNLQAGDIIVSVIGNGMLRKITSIDFVNNQVLIQTEQAALADVIKQGQIQIDTPLTVSNIKSIEYHQAGLSLDTSILNNKGNSTFKWDVSTIIYDHDDNLETSGDQIKLVGSLTFDWNLIMYIDFSPISGVSDVKYGFASEENFELKMIADLNYNFKKSKDLATINFNPIVVQVGPLPVIFFPQFKIKAGVDGFAGGKITTSCIQKLSFDAGIEYEQANGWTTYNTCIKTFNFNQPQLSLGAGAELNMTPELTLKVYDITGPYTNLKLYGKLNADLLQTPWWKLYGGLVMSAGVKAQIFDKLLFEFSVPDLIKYELLIAQASSNNIPPEVTTSVITSTTQTTATGGGNVASEGSSPVTGRGVCWSTSSNPTVKDNHTSDGSGTGSFNSNLTELNPETNYLVRAYAINSTDTAYGEQVDFTTTGNGSNTPPAAVFEVDPAEGTTSTIFNFNASGCHDNEDQSDELQVRWDWENDGIWDSPFTNEKTISHQYSQQGNLTIKMEVKDSGELTDNITHTIIIIDEPGGIPCPDVPTVTYEGQTYNTIQIGDQCWFRENLNVGTMGTAFPAGNEQLDNNIKEKWCYDDNPSNCETYGGLYQWNEMMQYNSQEGSQGICPTGWHIPTDEEWCILTQFLDPTVNCSAGWSGTDVSYKLRSTTGWSLVNGTNESGFTALPAGILYITTWDFSYLTTQADFWTSTKTSNSFAWHRVMGGSGNIGRFDPYMGHGNSVRCLKD